MELFGQRRVNVFKDLYEFCQIFFYKRLYHLKFSSIVCKKVKHWYYHSLWCFSICYITKMSLTALIFVSLIIRLMSFFWIFINPLFWGGILSSYFTVFVKQMLSYCFKFHIFYLCGWPLHMFICYWEDCLWALDYFFKLSFFLSQWSYKKHYIFKHFYHFHYHC